MVIDMFSVCWYWSFLFSPWFFHSSHVWCPFPPLASPFPLSQFLSLAFSPLSFCLAPFMIHSETFSLGSSSLISYLSLLFEKTDIQMKGQSNVTFAPGMFPGDSTCLWSPEEGAQVGGWAMEGKTSKEDGNDLDKIKGEGGHFRVTEAVGTKVWGFYQGKRDEERGSYLTGSGNCCLLVLALS